MPGPVEFIPTNNSGSLPSTLEIILGVLTFVLGLATVTVTVAQFRQGRAAKAAKRLRETLRQSDQPAIELTDYSSHVSDYNPADSR
jgi:hypothetical protein